MLSLGVNFDAWDEGNGIEGAARHRKGPPIKLNIDHLLVIFKVKFGNLSLLVHLLRYSRAFLKSQVTTAQGMTSMASAEHEPIMGFWGQYPSGGPGAESPVGKGL